MSNDPRCGKCRARVIMARTLPGEQIIRLDSEPTTAGHYELDLDALPMPTARRVRFQDLEPALANYLGDLLYIHHGETCSAVEREQEPEPQEAGG